MAKSKRKKREKAKDFAKPKLKVGRKLPRVNETDVTFSSQSVLLPNQMKFRTSQEACSHRKLNVQDLLSQLNHYSTSVRHDALTGLRELFRLHPTEITKHAASLLTRMPAAICDSDVAVRHALMSVFRDIFPHINHMQMTPFFKVFEVHVTSGLSHIHDDVRIDALQILDDLRENYSSLIVSSLSQIVPHLVGLLRQNAFSLETSRSQRSAAGAMSNRLQILSRLQAFLQLDLCMNQPTVPSPSQSKEIIVSSTAPTYVGLYKFGNLGDVKARQMSVSNAGVQLDDAAICHIVESVIPVVLEWWVECEPSQLLCESPVPPRSLLSMSLILDLIQTLWQLATRLDQQFGTSRLRTFLSNRYEKDFVKHFLTYFPFTATTLSNGYKRAMEKVAIRGVSATSVVDMNATLCSILTTVRRPDSAWMGQIMDYLVHVFNESVTHQMSARAFQTLLSTIQLLLNDYMSGSDSLLEEKLAENVSLLLSGLVSFFKSCHALSSKKESLLHFLVSILLKHDIAEWLRESWDGFSDLMSSWLDCLPRYLIALQTQNIEATHTVLKVICESSSRVLRHQMQQQMSEWLCECIDQGIVARFPSNIQRIVCECVYYCNVIPTRLLKSLVQLCQNMELLQVRYLIQILLYRSPQTDISCNMSHGISDAGLLSFCFSLLTGCSQADLSDIQSLHKDSEDAGKYSSLTHLRLCDVQTTRTVGDSMKEAQWQRHVSIVEAVIDTYKIMNNSTQLWSVYSKLFRETVGLSVLPVFAVYGLLKAATCWISLIGNTHLGESATCVSHLAVASLMWADERRTSGEEWLRNMSQDVQSAAIAMLSASYYGLYSTLSLLQHVIRSESCKSRSTEQCCTEELAAGLLITLLRSYSLRDCCRLCIEHISKIINGLKSRVEKKTWHVLEYNCSTNLGLQLSG